MNQLETGDLLLFNNSSHGWFGLFTFSIKYFTNSNYSHIGMILKDPTFIHPSLKGIYVWESSWNGKPDPQDGKIKLGVQITPIGEVLDYYSNNNGHVYVRKLNIINKFEKNDNLYNFRRLVSKKLRQVIFSDEKLKKIHDIVYNKPYDIVPKDWLEAIFRKDDHPQKIDRFWCSALVGYIYTSLGILKKNTDWSMLRPSDFSLDNEFLDFTGLCYLDDKEIKIL